MILTAQILLGISPQGNKEIIIGLVEPLNEYLPKYGISTQLRLDHFLGQAAEETAGFRTLTEYASGAEYEGRRDLGNTEPGDGPRFKGRGIFQLTGRDNYAYMRQKLGVDLVNNPEMAATPIIAVQTACLFWQMRGLNTLADNDDIQGITRRINGGLNGLNDREIFTDRADNILSPLFPSS